MRVIRPGQASRSVPQHKRLVLVRQSERRCRPKLIIDGRSVSERPGRSEPQHGGQIQGQQQGQRSVDCDSFV